MRNGFSAPILLVGILVALIGFNFLNHAHLKNVDIPIIKNSSDVNIDYNNPSLGFSLSSPMTLKIVQDSEEEFNKRGNGDFRKNFKGYVGYEPGKVLGILAILEDGTYEKNLFSLWVFDNPDDLNIDAWYKNYWYYPFVWGDFTYTGKVEQAPKMEATVSGQLGKSGIIDYQPGKPKFIYLSKDKKMYLFRIIGEGGNKILESFKFFTP